MNKTIKRKWLQELRSGNYKQGRTFLRRRYPMKLNPSKIVEKWCCLGVLADTTHPDEWDESQTSYYTNCGSGRFPNTAVTDAAKVAILQCRTLARMNDSEKPFSEIADWIEENL